MALEYSVEICKALEEKFRRLNIHRRQRVTRFDAGDEFSYEVTGVERGNKGSVHLVIEKFVGGGFAGQVYRVKITDIQNADGPIGNLDVGGVYAIKILIPPSNLSRLFRNFLYGVGFQGPFQLQCNPTASRAGAIWQKFIRRGAKIRFGDESVVNDVHATFVDDRLGSCGEISDWVDGRTWQLEVDEYMDALKRWNKRKEVDTDKLGSAEYRAKKRFMANFVRLLHNMGGVEFARQYEWSTCKSQPNCLKRHGTDSDPESGLVAVDFRAGLALLPFLPMSPGDFKLIGRGIMRGSPVQFDRGDIGKLQAFVDENPGDFTDMTGMLEELKTAEDIYRNSVPDITHNHFRLLYSAKLWSTILDSAITGWKVRNIIDEKCEQTLRRHKLTTLLFSIIGLVPFLGSFIRKIVGRADLRRHYASILTSPEYLKRSFIARMLEKVIDWYRTGRLSGESISKVTENPGLFLYHLPFSFLPVGLHRFFTDGKFRKQKLVYIFVRPFRLYFNHELREQWMRDMVTEGKKKHILSDEDADVVIAHIKEPYIQRYLVSLVVHLLTLPVTQIVSVTVAVIFYIKHPEMPPLERKAAAAAIIGIFQIIPISPGSICRGLYTTCLAIYERNFKDYNIALFLSYFKYIGYLAFPIQMSYHYPAMARFMAGHWATEAVHIVPVFGESGALFEHWVFCLFYNWPLTIRRRMRKIAEVRASQAARYWHVGLWAIVAAVGLGAVDYNYLGHTGTLPGLMDIWPIAVITPLICGMLVTSGCGGAVLWRRILAGTVCGIAAGVLYTGVSMLAGSGIAVEQIAKICVWRTFAFAVFSAIGVILTELARQEPDLV